MPRNNIVVVLVRVVCAVFLCGAILLFSSPQLHADTGAEPITVATWNVQLDDASPFPIGERIADFQNVDLWGITEVNTQDVVPVLETAAEVGEDADYSSILSKSGGGDRQLILYDTDRFELVRQDELEHINIGGNVRAPLLAHLRDRKSGMEFIFMVNHLYRSDNEARHSQAELLNNWVEGQDLPVIAVGDYNFDWHSSNGEIDHDRGYDLLTEDEQFVWVRPEELVRTQCSGWPCEYNSVLDFVFVAGPAKEWQSESEIVETEGDFPDDNTTSDHRPVLATFQIEPGNDDPGSSTDTNYVPTTIQLALPSAEGESITATLDFMLDIQSLVELAKSGEGDLRLFVNTSTDLLPLGTLSVTTEEGDDPPPPPPPPSATAKSTANLRSCYGTGFEKVGSVSAGEELDIIARSPEIVTGYYWYQLDGGVWIREDLVDNGPDVDLLSIGECEESPVLLEIISVDKRAEVVTIQNQGNGAINLRGWTLLSERGSQACDIRDDLILQPGASLNIHALTGRSDAANVYCGFSSNIWNNSKSDPAVLIDPMGNEISRY